MGQPSYPKGLAQCIGKLHLGAPQHQRRQQPASLCSSRGLKTISNLPPEIGDGGPGPPSVPPDQAAGGEHQQRGVSSTRAPERANPGGVDPGKDGAEAPCVRHDEPRRSTPPPQERSRRHQTVGHPPAADRSAARWSGSAGSSGMDQTLAAAEPPRTAPAAARSGRAAGRRLEQMGIGAGEIRPLTEVFPPPAGENPALPAPPARLPPPCGPGCESDRWWRCVR